MRGRKHICLHEKCDMGTIGAIDCGDTLTTCRHPKSFGFKCSLGEGKKHTFVGVIIERKTAMPCNTMNWQYRNQAEFKRYDTTPKKDQKYIAA